MERSERASIIINFNGALRVRTHNATLLSPELCHSWNTTSSWKKIHLKPRGDRGESKRRPFLSRLLNNPWKARPPSLAAQYARAWKATKTMRSLLPGPWKSDSSSIECKYVYIRDTARLLPRPVTARRLLRLIERRLALYARAPYLRA